MLDMIKSLPYFGSLIGFIISSFTTDIIGRKTTITVSLAITLTGSIIIVTGFNLLMVSIGVVLAGAGINIASAMTFCYLG
jgi:MFS family permease